MRGWPWFLLALSLSDWRGMVKLLQLWGEFSAAMEFQPCTAPPAVGEPLPVKAATELGPYSHLMSLG